MVPCVNLFLHGHMHFRANELLFQYHIGYIHMVTDYFYAVKYLDLLGVTDLHLHVYSMSMCHRKNEVR